MNKKLCFQIEDEEIYLEQVLVDYENILFFFLCKGKNKYYIALCIDIESFNYIVVQLSLSDTYNLLHGKIPMRDVILKQKEYWEIISGDEVDYDVVTKYPVDMLDVSLLPEKEVCFEIFTKEIEIFVQQFDDDYYANEFFSDSDSKAVLEEEFEDVSIETFTAYIEQELLDYQMGKTAFLEATTDTITDDDVYGDALVRSSIILEQCELNDSYKVMELMVAVDLAMAA